MNCEFSKIKVENALKFYMLATELKDKIRSGWQVWNVDRERLESVAEHIYGTCILAIALDSEFEFEIDLQKAIMMIVLHELEEIIIGDLTPLDNVSKNEKRLKGEEAVKKVLASLTKKDEYINLLNEFENEETFEAKYSRMCDKLECDIQIKLYCEEKSADLFSDTNKELRNVERIKNRIELEKPRNLADLFIENDRKIFNDEIFEKVLDFVKENELKKL